MNISRKWMTRANDRALRTITGGAVIFAGFGIIALVGRAIAVLNDRTIEVPGLQLANAESPAFASSIPSIEASRYESVTLWVQDLPAGVRWLLVSQLSLESLLGIGLCVIVFVLGMRLLDQRPFARSATWAIFAAAVPSWSSAYSVPSSKESRMLRSCNSSAKGR